MLVTLLGIVTPVRPVHPANETANPTVMVKPSAVFIPHSFPENRISPPKNRRWKILEIIRGEISEKLTPPKP
jgi:hypothetical protein